MCSFTSCHATEPADGSFVWVVIHVGH
jgi:hypothetical protein